MSVPILTVVTAISRLTQDSDNNQKEQYVPNLALQAVQMNIQPASAEDTAMIDGIFAKTYRSFTSNSGLMTGDLVTVSGTGSKYVIKGIQDWNYDPIPHFELLMVQAENFNQN